MASEAEKLTTDQRIALNLEAVASLGVCLDVDEHKIQFTYQNQTYDVWPHSDLWYSHSRSICGKGIKDLVHRLCTPSYKAPNPSWYQPRERRDWKLLAAGDFN